VRILIVDDSSFMRKRIASAVKEAGHEVVGMACDGEEGVEMYRSLRPDLVIMDVTMRGVDGIEAVRRIKSEHSDAKVVFMSLVSDPEVISQAKGLGALAWLGKNEHQRLREILAG